MKSEAPGALPTNVGCQAWLHRSPWKSERPSRFPPKDVRLATGAPSLHWSPVKSPEPVSAQNWAHCT
eukprot:298436-Lingulodinium_polyedra.AAC.1